IFQKEFLSYCKKYCTKPDNDRCGQEYCAVSIFQDFSAIFDSKPLVCNQTAEKRSEQHSHICKHISHGKCSIFSRVIVFKQTSHQCLGCTLIKSTSDDTECNHNLNFQLGI